MHIGHNLVGIAIGILYLPKGSSITRTSVHLLAFFALSIIPDYNIPGWGHSNYTVSHSLFVNLALMGFIILLLAWKVGWRTRLGGWPVVVGGSMAWMSHFLLDTFYKDSTGPAMFWPFSTAQLALPIPWFSTLHVSSGWSHILGEYAIELACYGPLVLLALAVFMFFRKWPHTSLSRNYLRLKMAWHSTIAIVSRIRRPLKRLIT